MIGTTVGKYQILERLGRGGMGIVYKAVDETLDREVAIKVLNPDVNDAELLKRFRGEAISLARLNHPGIATIYELHRNGDELLMVMEFVRGETLQTLSERLGPLDPPQAAHICVQILDALGHAHRAGIVHRDLKPANVMVTDTGVVKIMDFGIARMLGGEHFTHAGYMMGTPAYMAPEQVLGHEIDGRADLYSVGVLFYRLLTRELPFQADTAIAMAQKQVAEAPTPLRTFRPNLPSWCEGIIARALSKSPADRFQSAEAFRSAIRSAVTPATLGELPTMATPTPASLLKTSDLTLPLTGDPASSAPTATRMIADPDVTVAAGPTTAVASTTTTPASGTIPPTERTGTTVVLGRGHLMALAAMLIVLIGGIAALGFVALKRGGGILQTAETPAEPATQSSAAPEQPNQPASSAQPEQPAPQPPPAEASTPEPVPPSVPPAPAAVDNASAASGTAGRAEKAPRTKPAPKPSEQSVAPAAVPVPTPEPAAAEPPPPPPAAPEVAPITFKDVKVVLAAGNGLRDRDAVLRLTGDRLAVLDRAEKSEILSLPYASIVQAFYSRSKQPKWKGPDGKEVEVSVELGALGFFRGERNWLILTTETGRVIIRVENDELQGLLAAVRERTGLPIQRSTDR